MSQYRRFAFPDCVLRSPDRGSRVGCDDLANDQPVEEHADCRQVLLDRGLRQALSEHIYIGGHMQWLDIDDFREVLRLTPCGKLQNRMQISSAGRS